MRKWMRTACAALLCLGLPLCGCTPKPEPQPDAPAEIEVVPTEKPVEPHTGKYKDGVYTSGRKGYAGDVVVTATIANDQITEIVIEGANETKGVGSVAIERMRDRLMEAQSVPVDIVSGATVTSEAIQSAMADIFAKAQY